MRECKVSEKELQKFNDPKIEEKIIELIKKTEIPVSIDFIAQNVNIAWGTARAILLNLAVLGKIQAQKTTKSLIFWIDKNGDGKP